MSDVEAPIFSLDSRFTDSGKFVSLTRRQPVIPQEDSWYSFLLEAIVRLEELSKLKRVHLFGTRTHDLPLVAYCLNQLRYRVPPTMK
jgi:hypothetical protein